MSDLLPEDGPFIEALRQDRPSPQLPSPLRPHPRPRRGLIRRWRQWRYHRETRRLIREWEENARHSRPIILPPDEQIAELRRLHGYAVDTLRRLADPTEMAGCGEIETMTGPAAVELRCRIRHAELAVEWLSPRVVIQPPPGAVDPGQEVK